MSSIGIHEAVTRAFIALTFCSALALTASPAAAQVSSLEGDDVADRASEVYEEAVFVTRSSALWKERARAADLFRESADSLPSDDPRAFHAAASAGEILYSLGESREAMEVLIQAGDRALEVGQVVNAASAYLDAAWIAVRDGRGAEAIELATRGTRLASSPHLSTVERSMIVGRVGEGTLQATLPSP